MSGILAAPALLPVVRTPTELHVALQGAGSVGLVPTMGYLHRGHATLIEQARRENSMVVVSVFVNPLQFGPTEDLTRYPRDLERDRAVAAAAGADLIFHPDVGLMYPTGFSSLVSVGSVSQALEGASRPGHFDGVATVVLKLFNLVRPDRAYFGEKDWQQLSVVRQMVSDLNVPVDVVGVPTVRVASGPAGGLALSSRNSFLSDEQQARASVLSRALRAVQAAYGRGVQTAADLRQAGLEVLASEPEVDLDYLTVVDAQLQPLTESPPTGRVPVSDTQQPTPESSVHNEAMFRVLIAARMFGVRLIDNMPLVGGPASGGRVTTPAPDPAPL